MNYSKEGPPLNTTEIQLVSVDDLAGVLTRTGVPTPLQERIMKGIATATLPPEDIVGLIGDDLEELLDNLPEHERDKVERKAIETLKSELRVRDKADEELRTDVKREIRDEVEEELEREVEEKVEEKLGPLFDRYLAEVARGVFGFRLGELLSQERTQIEHIREELDIPGEFDADADRQHFR